MEDPLDQLVNIDFREMPLSNVVALLAQKAQINVVAGADVVGTVTAKLTNVPLREAIETVLRMNGLGMVEKKGIFYIVPYEQAVAERRATRMIHLRNAQAKDVKLTIDGILLGDPDAQLVSASSNDSTNTIIISGPEEKVDELEAIVEQLDVSEPMLPTVTEVIKLNYAVPEEIASTVEDLLTESVGSVSADERGRNLVVTDIPVVIEEIRALVEQLDQPVKQVSIETMIVDAVLEDSSQTGVDWLLNAVRRVNRRGETVGNLQNLGLTASMPVTQTATPGGSLAFGILSSDIDLSGIISAEVQASNANILANPVVVTVENKEATISISEEIPYQELTQTGGGGELATTEFKDVGTILTVTPRVTHDNHVIVNLRAKQSVATDVSETGVPVEDKREAETTLRAFDGQSVFIGGLRKFQDRKSVRKLPVLGDLPVFGLMFKNDLVVEEITELMIFLTCHVVKDEMPELAPSQQEAFDRLGASPEVPNAQRSLFRGMLKPQEMRDPMWKWRREK